MTRGLAILAMILTGALFGAWLIEASLAECEIAARQQARPQLYLSCDGPELRGSACGGAGKWSGR